MLLSVAKGFFLSHFFLGQLVELMLMNMKAPKEKFFSLLLILEWMRVLRAAWFTLIGVLVYLG